MSGALPGCGEIVKLCKRSVHAESCRRVYVILQLVLQIRQVLRGAPGLAIPQEKHLVGGQIGNERVVGVLGSVLCHVILIRPVRIFDTTDISDVFTKSLLAIQFGGAIDGIVAVEIRNALRVRVEVGTRFVVENISRKTVRVPQGSLVVKSVRILVSHYNAHASILEEFRPGTTEHRTLQHTRWEVDGIGIGTVKGIYDKRVKLIVGSIEGEGVETVEILVHYSYGVVNVVVVRGGGGSKIGIFIHHVGVTDNLDHVRQFELHAGERGLVQPGQGGEALVERGLDADRHVVYAADDVRRHHFVSEDQPHVIRYQMDEIAAHRGSVPGRRVRAVLHHKVARNR